MSLLVEFKRNADSEKVETILTNLPANWDEMDKMYSREDIYFHAIANMRVKVQGRVRQHYAKLADKKEDKSWKEDSEDFATYVKPRPEVDKVEKVSKAVNSMTPEQRAELLKALQADADVVRLAKKAK